MYKLIIRPFLFLLNPEKAHHATFAALKLIGKLPFGLAFLKSIYRVKHPSLERNLMGLYFPNPVGLAAGLDKNALVFKEMHALGFGFIEVGTATPLPQAGNPQPRLFRLPADQALINRMGFNNDGVIEIAHRLAKKDPAILVGGNIGKNKLTANEDAASDYLKCFEELYPYVDYFVVNVSSPNTPGLRALQEKEPLMDLINQLDKANSTKPLHKPILLKIAPDLSESELNDIADIGNQTKLAGFIATNTTLSREGLITSSATINEIGAGGLSGKPEREKSTAVIRYLRSKTDLPIIASGGIMSVADAHEKLAAGANLIQLYTGLIYEGPDLVKRINLSLIKN